LTATDDVFTLAHATLVHPERFEYLMEVAQAADSAKACRTLYCFVGHTHVPFVFEYDTARRGLRRLLSRPKELENVSVGGSPAERRYVVNPGSVGQPRDGDPRACYALLDTDAQQLSVHRVPYDVQAAQRKIREAELPELLAERLAVGR